MKINNLACVELQTDSIARFVNNPLDTRLCTACILVIPTISLGTDRDK